MRKPFAGRRYFATGQLKPTIREQGRSFRWVANLVNFSDSHFNRVMSGERWVTEENAMEIAEAIGVDFFSLWKLSDESNSLAEAA